MLSEDISIWRSGAGSYGGLVIGSICATSRPNAAVNCVYSASGPSTSASRFSPRLLRSAFSASITYSPRTACSRSRSRSNIRFIALASCGRPKPG